MNRNGMLLAIISIIVLAGGKALTISNRTVMLRFVTMVGIAAAVVFLSMFLVDGVIRKNNALRKGRITTRFVLYSIGAVATLSASLLQLFGPSGATASRSAIAWLIFLVPWFAYSAIREYRRTSRAK